MKLSRIKLLALLVSVLVSVFWIVSPTVAEAPGKKDSPVETQRILTIADWLRSLPEETRVQVVGIFDRTLTCPLNGGEKSMPEGQNEKETLYNDLQAVLTPGQFKLFQSVVIGNNRDSGLSTVTSESCDDCDTARIELNYARWQLYNALNDYSINYCDFPYIDMVHIYIGMAHYHAEEAYYAVYEAQFSCDCQSALDAEEHVYYALMYSQTAARNTAIYCDANSPWIIHLDNAIPYLALVKNYRLDHCIDQVCY